MKVELAICCSVINFLTDPNSEHQGFFGEDISHLHNLNDFNVHMFNVDEEGFLNACNRAFIILESINHFLIRMILRQRSAVEC